MQRESRKPVPYHVSDLEVSDLGHPLFRFGFRSHFWGFTNRAGLPTNFGRGVARAVYRLVSQSIRGNRWVIPARAGFCEVFLVVSQSLDDFHHNSSSNLCRNTATMPGKAAGDGKIYKKKKWLHHCQAMDLLFVPLAHENGGRMGEAARKFLDSLILRVGGTASERARYRCVSSS